MHVILFNSNLCLKTEGEKNKIIYFQKDNLFYCIARDLNNLGPNFKYCCPKFTNFL